MQSQSGSDAPGVLSRRAAIYGLSLLTLLNFVNYIDRYILAGVLSSIGESLRLSDTQLGMIASAFLFVYFLTSPIFGPLGDRWSRSRLMAIGVGVWSLATAGAGAARNFGQMLVARASVGVGEAAYATISPALISDYFPPERRGRSFAVFYVAIPVGAAVGYLLGGLLDHAFGWRSAFFIVGLPGLLLALLTLTVPDPPRGIQDGTRAADASEVPLPEALRAFWRNRTYTLTVLGYAAYTFAIGGLAIWAPTYFFRVRGMTKVGADFFVGAVAACAGLVGTFAGGYLGDRLQKRLRDGYLWLSGVSMLAAVPFAWIALTSADRTLYTGALFVAEFLAFLSTGPINVVIVSVVAVEMRATASAVSIFVIHLLGDAISPIMLGIVADRAGWHTAALIVPVVVGLSGLIWTGTAWRGSRK